jgi:hypothetical protein
MEDLLLPPANIVFLGLSISAASCSIGLDSLECSEVLTEIYF